MLKLSQPADVGIDSNVRKICLPFIAFNYPQSWMQQGVIADELTNEYDAIPERDNNFLRSIKLKKQPQHNHTQVTLLSRKNQITRRSSRRRNDKFLHDHKYFSYAKRSNNVQVGFLLFYEILFLIYLNIVYCFVNGRQLQFISMI